MKEVCNVGAQAEDVRICMGSLSLNTSPPILPGSSVTKDGAKINVERHYLVAPCKQTYADTFRPVSVHVTYEGGSSEAEHYTF